jgi:hypothetical protein
MTPPTPSSWRGTRTSSPPGASGATLQARASRPLTCSTRRTPTSRHPRAWPARTCAEPSRRLSDEATREHRLSLLGKPPRREHRRPMESVVVHPLVSPRGHSLETRRRRTSSYPPCSYPPCAPPYPVPCRVALRPAPAQRPTPTSRVWVPSCAPPPVPSAAPSARESASTGACASRLGRSATARCVSTI